MKGWNTGSCMFLLLPVRGTESGTDRCADAVNGFRCTADPLHYRKRRAAVGALEPRRSYHEAGLTLLCLFDVLVAPPPVHRVGRVMDLAYQFLGPFIRMVPTRKVKRNVIQFVIDRGWLDAKHQDKGK